MSDRVMSTGKKGEAYMWVKELDIRNGHRFFRDQITGRVAVADRSGTLPQNTDDGVLWLDTSRDMTAGMATSSSDARPWASVPLVRDNGDTCSMGVGLKDATRIAGLFGLKLQLSIQLADLVRALWPYANKA